MWKKILLCFPCNSLIINNVDHISSHVTWLWIFPPLQSISIFCPIFQGIVCSFLNWLIGVLYRLSILIHYHLCMLRVSFPSSWLVFSTLSSVVWSTSVSIFVDQNSSLFFHMFFKEILLLFCAQVFLIYVSYIVICVIFLFSPLKLYTSKIHCVMIRTSTLLLLLWVFQDIPAPHFTNYFHVGPFIHEAIYNVINSQNFPSNFPFSSIY